MLRTMEKTRAGHSGVRTGKVVDRGGDMAGIEVEEITALVKGIEGRH